MITQVLHCPYCHGTDLVRHGLSPEGKQRYRCRACLEGRGRTFLLEYNTPVTRLEVKQQIVDMALNASGIRDTARVLHVSPTTVINELKKAPDLQAVNHSVLLHLPPEQVEGGDMACGCAEVRRGLSSELDEMWSYVRSKAQPRWLWHALDHHTGQVLAYVLGRRQEICRSYYDSRKSLYRVVACGNHQCIGFVKARTVVSMSARTVIQEISYVQARPQSPRLCPSAPLKLRALQRRRFAALGDTPLETRRRLSQIMARVIAQHSLPLTQEVGDD